MAGLPVNQQCMYNDPSVYVKTEYDQGKIFGLEQIEKFLFSSKPTQIHTLEP